MLEINQNRILQKIILTCATLGMILIILGTALLFINHPTHLLTQFIIPLKVKELISQLLLLDPMAFVNVGLLIIMLVPILNVITLCIVFFLQRDWRYCLVAFGVFFILMLGIFLPRI